MNPHQPWLQARKEIHVSNRSWRSICFVALFLATPSKSPAAEAPTPASANTGIRPAAREEPELIAALNAAGGVAADPRALSAGELNELAAEVSAQGVALRGETIFRRNEQACLKCHAIAGAGGRVGPDLVSIGASAQIDYLIESILQPSAKIKENDHSLTVVADGRITSGIKVRETDRELVLRDVEDREATVPLEAIEERKEGGSLMPAGLADSLTRGELVDLVRFLSELGKVGPYATSQARVVRRWQALLPSAEAAEAIVAVGNDSLETTIDDGRGMIWTTAYIRVSGSLPLDSLPVIHSRRPGEPRRVVRCQVDATTGGSVGLLARGPIAKMWLDATPLAPAGKGLSPGEKLSIDVPAGTHTVTIFLEGKSNEDLRLEIVDERGSQAQVQIVGGK
jgi:putative heme-binding domain-containing protein